MKVLLVDRRFESEFHAILDGITLLLKEQVLMDPGQLLSKQVVAVAKSVFYQLQLVSHLGCPLTTVMPTLVKFRLYYCNML